MQQLHPPRDAAGIDTPSIMDKPPNVGLLVSTSPLWGHDRATGRNLLLETVITSPLVLGWVEAVCYRWPKRTLPSGGHSCQRAWKNSLPAWNSLALRFIYALPAMFFSLSLPHSVSITLSMPPFPFPLSLTPTSSFPYSSLAVQHFLFLSITSVPPHSLNILASLLPPVSLLLLSCLSLIWFHSSFFLSDKIYVCPPTLTRTPTHTHRCTHPLLSFCPSYLDLYQPASSGPLPALLGEHSWAERKEERRLKPGLLSLII